MEPKTLSEISRVYNDFEPSTEWTHEEGYDTLLVFLPEFKWEEMEGQITSSGNIRVMGERRVGGNKWSRFYKEVPTSSNHDTNRVTAKFEKGILLVKLPIVIVPDQPPPLEDAEKPTPDMYKQVLENYVPKLKMALLLVLLLILYAKNVITSTGNSQTELFEDL